jgi:hypothetical protein
MTDGDKETKRAEGKKEREDKSDVVCMCVVPC